MQSAGISLGVRPWTIADVETIAAGRATLEFPAATRAAVERSYAFVQAIAASNRPAYGLTTGCGPLSAHRIDPAARQQFQYNLVRSHAVTLGPAHPTAFVRAAMAVRANVLAHGMSGVAPQTIETICGMLKHGLHPVVSEIGSVGASGDLLELAQIALAVFGEGSVTLDGGTRPAAEAMRNCGVEPLVPRYREGIALINGTSFHTAGAALLLARAERVADAAEIAAALSFEALHGSTEALDAALAHARPHVGHAAVAARLRRRLAGSQLVRTDCPAATQDAYTLRCIPQIAGSVSDVLASTRAVVETELRSVTDNPLFVADEDRIVHGGNFHGQPVALALDHFKIGLVELGVLIERRLARLLDAKLNDGLPAFLIRGGPGVHNGFMGLQYCCSSMAAENAVLATPASIHSVPTNANNQDIVSMGPVALRHARRVLDNVARMTAIECLAAAQAVELRAGRCGTGTAAALAAVRAVIPPLTDDRPMTDDVARALQLIDDGSLQRSVDAIS